MSSRYYPINKGQFCLIVEPIITQHKKPAGRPAKRSNYQAFNAICYILRTGIPWRDLPPILGQWHTIYTRFKRWSKNGLMWSIIKNLHKSKHATFDMVWLDSTAIKLHRHGAGAPKKRQTIHRQNTGRMDNKIPSNDQ